MGDGWLIAARVAHELTLFAALGFLIGGLDELLVDLVYLARRVVRATTVYRRHPRATVETLPQPAEPPRLAIFLPLWDESAVVAPMLAHALRVLADHSVTLYLGTYPNDAATLAAAAPFLSPRVRVVVNPRPGPTTKADALNQCWRALLADEAAHGMPFAGVALHDAEDVVHAHEYTCYASLLGRFDLVQLPVEPLPDPRSRWVSGVYIDEFAEHHGKTLVVREAVGAGVPAAGVGCAFGRDLLARIAAGRGGEPFDADSLTEDYELGLRVAELGGRTAFVRIANRNGERVAVRAHFPATVETAARQKARWIAGIALHGWDRLGWFGGVAEAWMRLRDRRALVAAVIILLGYAALALTVLLWLLAPAALLAVGPPLQALLAGVTLLLVCRLAVRAIFVGRSYGWREGLRSVPRAVVANFIAVLAARRALTLYLRARRDGQVRWDKTAHIFPGDQLAG